MDFFRYTGISILTSHDAYGLSVVEVFRQVFLSTNKLKTVKMLQVCFDYCACCNSVGEVYFFMKAKRQQPSSCIQRLKIRKSYLRWYEQLVYVQLKISSISKY